MSAFDIFEALADEVPDDPALVCGDQRHTWGGYDDAAARFARSLGERDLVAALTQGPGRLEARGAGADDQHVSLRRLRPDALGMPAAPPFLAHRRILGAAARRHGGIAGDADVAADAFANVFEAAFLDFLRQEGIGDRRPRRTDEVEHAAPHL